MHDTDAEIDRIAPTRRPQERIVMRQTWQDLLFLHWPVDAAVLQALLPTGLTVDTWDGIAYVGLVPFTMRNVRPVWAPSVPGLSHFHECNVRTYVHYAGRDPGVWFFSLDAANRVAVELARRLFFLPYFWAEMSLRKQAEKLIYHSQRYTSEQGRSACDVTYTPQGHPMPAAPGTLEFFLTERYLLYSVRGDRLFRGQVHHMPYPLQGVDVHSLSQTLIEAAGIRAAVAMPPLQHYAAGVNVTIFPLHRVHQAKAMR